MEATEPVHLEKISVTTFSKIIEYLEKYNYTAPPAIKKPIMHSSIFKVVNDQWDAHFISSLNETDFEDLLISAHYLNIDCILDLCLAKLACEMYELNAGQVETRFGLPPL